MTHPAEEPSVICRPPLPPGPWLVVGLKKSGIAAAEVLVERGHEVFGVDTSDHLESEPEFPFQLKTDGTEALTRVRAVVKSPGVPPRAPAVAAARRAGMPVIGELELGWRLMPTTRFIAISGTNGKTTTTAWLEHILTSAGIAGKAAGNIGTPLTSMVDAPPALVACECSSFQLFDTIAFVPEVGVLLNLESDHLDWHESREAYHQAKLKGLFSRQGPNHCAITPAGIPLPGSARHVEITPEVGIRLAGRHNQLNAGAVAAAARALGLDNAEVVRGLASFEGVPHRLQKLPSRAGLQWINDSKATNVHATLAALAATPGPVHLILGGSDAKKEDFAGLRDCGAELYLIGEAAGRLMQTVGGTLCGDLENAVRAVLRVARPGDTVLLSPACPSHDQFVDFASRGDHFSHMAGALL